jgi:hypothetical protein
MRKIHGYHPPERQRFLPFAVAKEGSFTRGRIEAAELTAKNTAGAEPSELYGTEFYRPLPAESPPSTGRIAPVTKLA